MAVNKVDLANGETLIDLTGDSATEAVVFEGATFHGADGEKKTGKFTISPELTEQGSLIKRIKAALEGKAAGGGGTEPDPRDQYQRVEYITSDANSYITTDFVADNESGMEMVASFPSFADHACMGSREDSGNTRFYAPYPLSATSTYFGFNAATKVTTSTLTVDSIYICQTNFLNSRLANVYDRNGVRKGSTSINETLTAQSYPICLFRYNNAGTPTTVSRVLTLYGARCSQKNEVVREYIPCYRKSDGVIGLLEKFTGTFHANAGTGSFTTGPDIDW